MIATVLDGTILVVQAGRTPREALARGAAKLRQGNVKVLGVVLNGVRPGTTGTTTTSTGSAAISDSGAARGTGTWD